MRIQTAYMSSKNHPIISNSNDSKADLQGSQSRVFLKIPILQFEVLAGLLQALPDLMSALGSISPLLSRATRLVIGTSRLLSRCSLELPGAPKGHCFGPVNSQIFPRWDSSLTNTKYSQGQKCILLTHDAL